MDGRICTAAPLALANQLPLARLLKCAILGKQRRQLPKFIPSLSHSCLHSLP